MRMYARAGPSMFCCRGSSLDTPLYLPSSSPRSIAASTCPHHPHGPSNFRSQHVVIGCPLPSPQHSLHGSKRLPKPRELETTEKNNLEYGMVCGKRGGFGSCIKTKKENGDVLTTRALQADEHSVAGMVAPFPLDFHVQTVKPRRNDAVSPAQRKRIAVTNHAKANAKRHRTRNGQNRV